MAIGASSGLHLRDTLTGTTRPLLPLDPKEIGIYSCGPTIYGPAHIGNFRSFLFADLLVRWLRASGHTVRWVVNLTDIATGVIKAIVFGGIIGLAGCLRGLQAERSAAGVGWMAISHTSDENSSRCTASRKHAFFTAITAITVICRCTSSAAGICSAPGCGPPISIPPTAASTRLPASSPRSAHAGRRRRS